MFRIFLVVIFISLFNIAFSQTNPDFNLENTFNPNLTDQERKEIKDNIYNYSQILHQDPQNAVALINRGSMYAQLGLYPDAITDYNSALRIDSTISQAYYNRGIAKARFRYTKPACLDIKKAAELGLDPAVDVYDNNCGLYKRELGEIKK
ncbi:MAG: tetratricopeptide repeat protein [Bacteroidota bacterium]